MVAIIKDIPEAKLKELDKFFFDKEGNYILHSAADILKISAGDIAVWCHKKAIYGLPSQELVSFLKNEIREKKAIEIGAGHGYLGNALNIPQTDSYLQERRSIRKFYNLAGQPTINYPNRVRKLNAIQAITRFKPEVVIGSWITQRGTAEIPQSSAYGPNEEKILKMVKKYIMIGHISQHDKKIIRKYPHQVIYGDWICSRSLDRSGNIIYIWEM